MGHLEPFEQGGEGGKLKEFLRGILVELCVGDEASVGRREGENVGPLSQELRRFTYTVQRRRRTLEGKAKS